ncbi:TetR/AcrR family transcriptional regulator [Streptococcus iniae]|uniref:TetR/AcrR family transcriptional regulator n=2 Tax=Streptococcus iniae TaxID=1346 RepID=A0A1S1XRF1_STRIN|nr:helix-turn-helix domain-containing protein [Streptococcus iniae]AJG25252.1 AcrR family transcriptional regulator [Streptococcus iniae]ATX38976.1 hypothetical protein CTW00_00775 [Streptococcus iniae]EKB52341.1 AcrR family transcriptional regulator [Streptococcus iniae 9117]ELY5748567.1 TetR/AcrR family transcriptional regulator [Streptococcus iniae]ELY5750234.1 TetR/AcrR family transcriptional regulator [Streptococcus iniae]
MKEVKNSIAMKSRQELIQALLRLMKNNNYQLITVSEISDEAQLSRRTFYRIYDSKNDILEDIFYQLSEDYKAFLQKEKHYSFDLMVGKYFEFWEMHMTLLTIILEQGLFYQLIKEINRHLPRIYEEIKGEKCQCHASFDKSLTLMACSGALWNILKLWVSFDTRPRPIEMVNYIKNTVSSINNSIQSKGN